MDQVFAVRQVCEKYLANGRVVNGRAWVAQPVLELVKARFSLLGQKPILYHEWSGMVETHDLYH